MTFAERIAAVQGLGFTSRQAAFLTTVVLHSGYCVRRQYAAFAGVKYGKNVRDFLDSLVERKLADRIGFRADRGSVYHLFGRRLYAAIGQEHNRNRRHASPPMIARNLMLLDFVLAHHDFDWYATEADKAELFVTRLGIPASILPQRTYDPANPGAGSRRRGAAMSAVSTTRHWIHKLPVFQHGASVNFVCVVTDPHASTIETFIREHVPLLRHLTDWALNALIPQGAVTSAACEAAYTRALSRASMLSVSKEDLEWFTSTRVLVASGDLRSLTLDDLRRYRVLSTTLGQRLTAPIVSSLAVHHLPHSYTQFGSFAGIT